MKQFMVNYYPWLHLGFGVAGNGFVAVSEQSAGDPYHFTALSALVGVSLRVNPVLRIGLYTGRNLFARYRLYDRHYNNEAFTGTNLHEYASGGVPAYLIIDLRVTEKFSTRIKVFGTQPTGTDAAVTDNSSPYQVNFIARHLETLGSVS